MILCHLYVYKTTSAFTSECRLNVKDSAPPPLTEASMGAPMLERGSILWWCIQGHLSKCPRVLQSVTLHQSKLSVCLYVPFDCVKHPPMHTHTHTHTHTHAHTPTHTHTPKAPQRSISTDKGLSKQRVLVAQSSQGNHIINSYKVLYSVNLIS